MFGHLDQPTRLSDLAARFQPKKVLGSFAGVRYSKPTPLVHSRLSPYTVSFVVRRQVIAGGNGRHHDRP